jgi:glycosyltransferase involved in cell wall biosynthesis
VKDDLEQSGVDPNKIVVIPNAVEDYWFANPVHVRSGRPARLVFLGRLGGDAFTLKLKGLDRLIAFFEAFPQVEKVLVGMTNHERLAAWMRRRMKRTTLHINERKDKIPELLSEHAGSILFIPSRYEGFSLSLIEGMSQGLVPIIYRVGIAPEIIVNGKNGYIVDSLDEAKERARELLANEKERLRMAKHAIACARQFTTVRMAKEMKQFYQRILETYPHKKTPS